MKNEQQFFDEISNVLHTYEDAYHPGAWEEFVKAKKRRRGLVWLRYATAAAVLLMVGYAAWVFTPAKHIATNNQQAKTIKRSSNNYPGNTLGTDSVTKDHIIALQQRKEDQQPDAVADAKQQVATQQPNVVINSDTKKLLQFVSKPDEVIVESKAADVAATVPVTPETVTAQQPAQASNNLPIVTTEPRRYERGKERLNYDSLANFNKTKTVATETKKTSNLSYGLMVSPSVGNQKMNFGTGVEVAYNINKNFAVSSGISYAYVNAGSNRNGIQPEGMQADSRGYNASFGSNTAANSFNNNTSSRTVQGVQLALSGLELPLNFQYKTKNGFYVSAGLSAMSVIRNNISYDYLDSRTVSTPSANGLSATLNVVTEKTTEQSRENLSGYIGFYTLSAGKKISFGKGKLNFAPFIKVPFNRVSSENLQLMHGGVQLGFGF